ncbi:HET-domain-containing protein [Decorospora gaudefroyi]|uniref:HET-domain-containing protein n=1 Tax=Decorospora gaudefroyi TaxID=184978 RepID=A0A6A5K8Y6_9PLEO|nr:HET-domain-containing protein [Decorospora gaudefroyi]
MLKLASLKFASPREDTEYPPFDRNDIPIGFPVLPEPESATRFALLRAWLKWCDTTHPCNQQNVRSQGASPTRLIYVGYADLEVLRPCFPKEDEGVKYTALSHRWGNDPPSEDDPRFCTTDSNIDARLTRFRLSELPVTFQDAVQVTQELGIEYLWIDSLCIIQWNADDWKREAGRMEDVFASAYCTIAATSAVDSNAGFLARNTSTEYVRVQDAAGYQVCFCAHMDDFEKDVEQAGLNKRAWVMQERVLAKRTIHFSANQTYWECGEGVHCENLTKMLSSPRKNYFLLDPSFPDHLLKTGKGRTVEFIHFLFENYSKRELTEPTDRRAAASGLEARIAGALHCNSKHGIFEEYLHRNLLWQTSDSNTKRIMYDEDRQVPSWSWMACGGGVKFIEVVIGFVSWINALAFDAERDSAALIADVGKLQHVTLKPHGDRYTVSNFFGRTKGWIQYDVGGGESGSRDRCVVVGRTEEGEKTIDKKSYYILVVLPTREDGSDNGEYKRIGVGMVRTGCVKRLRASVRIV